MLKIIKIEILIIGILLLIILIPNNLHIDFYNYLPYFKNFLQQIYIIKFFENITILGDSLWYFQISIFFIVVFFFLKKFKILKKYKSGIESIQYYNLLLFSSILSSGILTQIIKHVVGRPRPSVLNFENEFNLKFFTLDSSFHSFPSGHTTTIFAVALVISLIAPKLKFFFHLLAIIISLSRVAIGVHFITDIIGGVAIACIGFKLSKLILSKTFNFNEGNNKSFIISDNYKLVIFFFLLLSFFLAIGPTLDIFISDLFHLGKSRFGENQFLIQSYYYISLFFRKIILGLIICYIFIFPIFSIFVPIKQIYFGYYFKMKEILYIWILTISNLVIFVGVLKNTWGRARPNEILELGGKDSFTPWYQISNQCTSNCSFVSGDAAVGFSLIVFYFLIKKEAYLWLALFFGLVIGAIRIMAGGHFFSDVIFSCLITFLFNLLIYSYYSKKNYE